MTDTISVMIDGESRENITKSVLDLKRPDRVTATYVIEAELDDLVQLIKYHDEQAALDARIAERKEVALDNYRGQTFSASTNWEGKFNKFLRNNELRIKQLEQKKEAE